MNSVDQLYAIDNWKTAAEEARQQRDQKKECIALANLGNIYQEQKNYTSALSFHQQALHIAREIKDISLELRCLRSVGTIHHLLRDNIAALQYLSECEERAEHEGATELQLRALFDLVRIHSLLGDFRKAEAAGRKGLDAARLMDSEEKEKDFLRILKTASEEEICFYQEQGSQYYRASDYPRAVESFEKAVAAALRGGNRQKEQQLLTAISDLTQLESIKKTKRLRSLIFAVLLLIFIYWLKPWDGERGLLDRLWEKLGI